MVHFLTLDNEPRTGRHIFKDNGSKSPVTAIFPRRMHCADTDAGIELQNLLSPPTFKGSVSVTCVDCDADHYIVQEIADLPDY
jgi:hypothetical protein